MKLYKHHMNEKRAYYIGIVKRFQGFGFMVSFDNPTWGNQGDILISLKILYLTAWLTIYNHR